MKTIIGLHGKGGVGKDTVADFIKDMPIGKVETVSIASPMKEVATLLWGWDFATIDKDVPDIKTGIVPRAFLEDFGTDYIRGKWGDEDVWNRILARKISESTADVVVVTDVRREDEVRVLKDFSGHIVKVEREKTDVRSNHITNAGLGDELVDWKILNNGTLEDLKKKTESVVYSLMMDSEV